jgi:hypothetical protein
LTFRTGQVDARFLCGVVTSQKLDVTERPQANQVRVGAVSGGKEHIRIEEDSIHGSGTPRATAAARDRMRDLGRVEPHFSNGAQRGPVILGINGVGKKEFGLTLRRIDFHRQDDRRTDQDALGALLRYDELAFFDPEFAPQTRWDHNHAALSDLACLHYLPPDSSNV